MLIKDEVFTAALLTNPEKYKRDRRRFNVNPYNGDRITYRHHNRPEFEIFGRRIRFEWKSREWQLRIVAGLPFLRRLLPGWHRRERDFRDWYAGLVNQLNYRGQRDYQRWVAILSTPEVITGFREIRYPKMDAARRQAEALLATDPSKFDSGQRSGPAWRNASRVTRGTANGNGAAGATSVSLPVVSQVGA